MDLPQQPAIIDEYVTDTLMSTSEESGLEITDLSFYNVLAGGMCSGSSSSGPASTIEASVKAPAKKA